MEGQEGGKPQGVADPPPPHTHTHKRPLATVVKVCRYVERKKKQQMLQKSRPGVNVMVTIICDFRHFSAKKWRFSQKPML
jgi:hypothetical protein